MFYHIPIFRFSVNKLAVFVFPITFPASINQSPAFFHKLPIHHRYKQWNHMDVCNWKRNKLFQTVLCSHCLNEFWLYWILGWTNTHPMEATSMLLQFLSQACQLHCSFSVYWLLSVSRKPYDNSRCDVAYRKLFSYHGLAHEPACTSNTDDQSIEPHCSMFLQALLAFSIHHMSNLILYLNNQHMS